MRTAKIVIGANFGDEGKGLMTDYFANEAKKQNKSCIVVCHNGGSQKGHTVVSPSGLRHVFHHFGSGNFAGADTYLSSQFIVNPIIFNKELAELNRKNIGTKCYIHGDCMVTTPFDMMINQIVEEYRGNNKHGSCGLGIFETITRTKCTSDSFSISQFNNMTVTEKVNILNRLADNYVVERLKQLGVSDLPLNWVSILGSKDSIIENFLYDFETMMNNIQLVDDDIIDGYEYVIFEGAQGLLLDQNNTSYMPHLTPSNTGVRNPIRIIGTRGLDIEVCYVSRTYMTRHGAGRFDTECKKESINPKIIDLTNVPNPYQDSIRYGTLDLDDLKGRIEADIEADLGGLRVTKSIAITHCNEFNIPTKSVYSRFADYKIYMSDGMTHNDINTI